MTEERRGWFNFRSGEELMTPEEVEEYGEDIQILLPAGLRCAACGNRTNGTLCKKVHENECSG